MMKKNRSGLGVEMLETRAMLSPVFLSEDGTLTVYGSDLSDRIVVSADNAHVCVVEKGGVQARVCFDRSDVRTVNVYAGSGIDKVTVKGNLKAYVDGGDGNDVLTGGSADDYLYGGEGDDRINGGDGDDYLIGASGRDRLNGGRGDDYLNGGYNSDVLIGGAGNDTLVGDNFGCDDALDRLFGGPGFDTAYIPEVSHDRLAAIEQVIATGECYG